MIIFDLHGDVWLDVKGEDGEAGGGAAPYRHRRVGEETEVMLLVLIKERLE